MKAEKVVKAQCQGRIRRGPSKGRCIEDATWGLYAWARGETDVKLDRKPEAVYCGRHVPKLDRRSLLRLVKLKRA